MHFLSTAVGILLISLALFSFGQENRDHVRPSTRPPEDNDRTLRDLSPEEIPPNLNFYAIDPLYNPDAVLGWASERIEERLGRGLHALVLENGKVYLSWRLLKDDDPGIAFNLYRLEKGEKAVRLNSSPITQTTDWLDSTAPSQMSVTYSLRSVTGGVENKKGFELSLSEDSHKSLYHTIKLQDITSVDRIAVGDLNGDGIYDYVVKHPRQTVDPGRNRPSEDSYKIDGYDGKTGEFMWRIDLGWNINQGIWFSPMVVRDLDGDNKAEVCLKTAPFAATRDQAIGGGDKFVIEGPEYLSVYDGQTGKELDRVDWIERDKVQNWGDNSGNRSLRHMMGIAYLDGKTPSVLAVRGIYGMMKIDAWVFRDKKLEKVWRWTNERAPFMYQGQGQHSIKTGDIDNDGCDEILNGSVAIDHDGRTMWCTGLGHGDRFYLSDIEPERPGLEVWYIIEEPHPQLGANLRDARTGDLLFGIREATNDNELGRAIAGDIDPAFPGMEVAGERFYFTAQGKKIHEKAPPQDYLVWWDADKLREILHQGRVFKWKGDDLIQVPPNIQMVADLLGDWREEIVVFAEGELRIYTTVIPAVDRRICLMQDPLYRNDVTHRSMGYPHSPMTGYYLGE